MIENSFRNRTLGKSLFGCIMLACALAGYFSPPGRSQDEKAALVSMQVVELPLHWQGAPVRPLALSAVEQRFADRFPGRITRLTDDRQIIVLRDVAAPTRMLHPAVDCYRALGYRIEGEHLENASLHTGPTAAEGPLATGVQRCFVARKDGIALRVCEQIEDARGQRFADTSAWYWAATMGQSSGPWRAVTVTQALSGGSI